MSLMTRSGKKFVNFNIENEDCPRKKNIKLAQFMEEFSRNSERDNLSALVSDASCTVTYKLKSGASTVLERIATRGNFSRNSVLQFVNAVRKFD